MERLGDVRFQGICKSLQKRQVLGLDLFLDEDEASKVGDNGVLARWCADGVSFAV